MTVPGIAREILFQASKESGASFAYFAKIKTYFKQLRTL